MAALYADLDAFRESAADVRIVTSDGQTIAAHSYILASASPVLERMIDMSRRGCGAGGCTIRVLGVPSDAVLAFLHLLSASRVEPGMQEAALAAHAPQLLALAHAYRVGWLKRAAEAAVSARLTPARAVDMLKLAGLCDAPRLRAACARLAAKDLAAIEASDGWRFARRHDPALELELLQLLEEADQRRARWVRERASREAYRQLAEAMDALDRIFAADDAPCSTTCGSGGKPCARDDDDNDGTCQGLRLLMRHFAGCARKAAPGGCPRCRRLLQLFRLHASVCDRPEQDQDDQPCRVPLCSHFTAKMQAEKADKTWQLLVKKVTRARAMARLGHWQVPEVVAMSWARYNSSSKWARLR
ncbi:BTB/POZ and TAZ domain-containing protein 2 [Dichanthelium oligosanthes]|uniref:BTB/POZ and TAZ domain-containing protein 2 n=1 Tax=Dichanthelium oligosanthes TaxID=888268 RepID=A0A1E5WLI1_9POAL|nr:BTB/POZ and TAZ domain-containing protein 2 [Dichanthelium oligosanthes]